MPGGDEPNPFKIAMGDVEKEFGPDNGTKRKHSADGEPDPPSEGVAAGYSPADDIVEDESRGVTDSVGGEGSDFWPHSLRTGE